MRTVLVLLVVVHGLIHLIGFVRAFHLARVDAIQTEIGRPTGLVWLAVAIAFLTTAAAIGAASNHWPFFALPAIAISQVLIAATWSDSKAGTVANVVLLAAAVLALFDRAPGSLRSTYERDVEERLAAAPRAELVTEADLAGLPGPVQTYLRRVGVVGKPRMHDVRIAWKAQMRRAPDAGWMTLRAEQYSFFDDPTRLFFMEGWMYGVPFVGLHRYARGEATMQVRLASVLDIVDGRGPTMNQSETVTMFNDMCVFAPATILGAPITWEPIDARRVRGTYTNGKSRISAELVFDDAGDLVDFVSDDRFESADGKTFRSYRWSTPLSDYRDFAGRRVATKGDAVWKHPEGDFVYGRFEIESIAYNVGAAPAAAGVPTGVTAMIGR
ncbi:MAG: hypothetical protein JST00_38555 [Deltaproteobacteria bacterium]|nr:hypothetical protein [Deltaproteobacteria bacterium]